MSNRNPYRAAGTYAGPSYILREADAQLLREIDDNQRYPYFLAPRQSGKSSLIASAMRKLERKECRTVFIDISTFRQNELNDYDDFLRAFSSKLLTPLGLTAPGQPFEDLSDLLKAVTRQCGTRVIIFVDEIDRLLSAPFKDTFFGEIRAAFNDRAFDSKMEQVQFVLAGAAQPTQLISDRNMSPFNVGELVRLNDLSLAQIRHMSQHLRFSSGPERDAVCRKIQEYTGGSVYLTQLIFERLWEMQRAAPPEALLPEHVRQVANKIIAQAPENLHFINIQTGVAKDAEALAAFRRLAETGEADGPSLEHLKITGITDGKGQYRNLIYERVFGPGGPLSLFEDVGFIIGQATRRRAQELSLRGQNLDSLPPALFKLKTLRKLDLSNNRLTVLPPGIAKLTRLRELNLRGNQLTALPPQLGRLSELLSLNVSDNRLSALPAEVGQLVNLTSLDLRNNQLKELHGGVAGLINLRQLKLRDNLLTIIPSELGSVANLQALDLSGNPIVSPPPEVVRGGTEAVLAYLRGRMANYGQLWVAKLLMVGDGGVGKTSLLKTLRGDEFELNESTTHGVDIHSLALSHPEKPNVTMQLDAWDFGGQAVYHAYNRLFFTNQALFLLVWNSRWGFDRSNFYYWLETIDRLAPNSPILIVATHTDQRRPDSPLGEIQAMYPRVIGQYEVSNYTGEGIAALKDALARAAAGLPMMGASLPKPWVLAVNAIRSIKEPYISFDRLRALALEHGVPEQSLPSLMQMLHELGEVLYFQDDPDLGQQVVIDSGWVASHIAEVLESREVIQRRGRLSGELLRELWRDVEPDMRHYLMRLLERFGLSYRVRGQEDQSLIIEHLPFERPEGGVVWDDFKPDGGPDVTSMRFNFRLALPSSVPGSFIARSHRFVTKMPWRYGAVFTDGRKRTALVQASPRERYMELVVRGPSPHNFFALLRDGVEEMLKQFPGMEVSRQIPCPGHMGQPCQNLFDYELLLKHLERGRESIECAFTFMSVSLNDLLFGLSPGTITVVLDRLDELEGGLLPVKYSPEFDAVVELRSLAQRELTKQLGAARHPRVCVLEPAAAPELYFMCEEPGRWHPVEGATGYRLRDTHGLLPALAPLFKTLVPFLRHAMPFDGLELGPLAPTDFSAWYGTTLNFTARAAGLSGSAANAGRDPAILSPRLMQESADALRAVGEFVASSDTVHARHRLKRIVTPEGHLLWLCAHHARGYTE